MKIKPVAICLLLCAICFSASAQGAAFSPQGRLATNAPNGTPLSYLALVVTNKESGVTLISPTNLNASPYFFRSGQPQMWLAAFFAPTGKLIPLLTVQQEAFSPAGSGVISSWGYGSNQVNNAGRFVGAFYNWELEYPTADPRTGILKFWAYSNLSDGAGGIIEIRSSSGGAEGTAFGTHGVYNNAIYLSHMGPMAFGNLTDDADPGQTESPLEGYLTNAWVTIIGDGTWTTNSQLPQLKIFHQQLVSSPVPDAIENDSTNLYVTLAGTGSTNRQPIFTGYNASGLTNLPARAITGGFNTNILVGGHTLYITNGIIMNVQ
jgi:hypothetical protein